jgi:hypothetical protein
MSGCNRAFVRLVLAARIRATNARRRRGWPRATVAAAWAEYRCRRRRPALDAPRPAGGPVARPGRRGPQAAAVALVGWVKNALRVPGRGRAR